MKHDAGLIGQVLSEWQGRLRLGSWQIRFSELACEEEDSRSTVDIDPSTHFAVIRFDPTLPEDQYHRQIVHELLHVRLAIAEDAFNQADTTEVLQTWFKRGQESAIEALVDALLPDHPRREYRGAPVWIEK